MLDRLAKAPYCRCKRIDLLVHPLHLGVEGFQLGHHGTGEHHGIRKE